MDYGDKRNRIFDRIAYVVVIIFALAFLVVGNRIASEGLVIDYRYDGLPTIEAVVTEVIGVEENVDQWWAGDTVTFEARIVRGGERNYVVAATQALGGHWAMLDEKVNVGDRVVLVSYDEESKWHFIGLVRINGVLILAGIFVVMLLIFGGFKGLNALLALVFTCAAIFLVFIPAILSGRNIYISSIIVCIYSIVVALFILYGINKKSLASLAGCLGGLTVAGLITVVMNFGLRLTGLAGGDSEHLLFLPLETPIDLRAIIFSGIIIGAVGAIMDVSVSVSSALWELKSQAPWLRFKELYSSGVNIGRDIMGSMVNTLMLAYIGSSMAVILILVVYSTSFIELFNQELVIVELLKAIVGSLGILFTMPLTALASAALLIRK